MTNDTTCDQDRQVSLFQAFGWFTLICMMVCSCASLARMPGISSEESISLSSAIPILFTWTSMTILYVYRRKFAPLVMHCFLPVLIAVFLVLPGHMRTGSGLALAAAMVISMIISSLFYSQVALLEFVSKTRRPVPFLIGYAAAGMLVTMGICMVFPSLNSGRPDGPAAVFGALLGFWVGVHEVVARSRYRNKKIAGVKLGGITAAGFLGAVFGPMLNELVTRNYLVDYFIPPRWSPAIGFLTATLAFSVLWVCQRNLKR